FARVLSESPPADAARLLNALFEEIIPEIVARGGAVDKFVGDAVMAVFQGPGHAARAVEACVAARAHLEMMAPRTGEGSLYAHGPCAAASSGRVFYGSIGSQACGHLGYTVVGEAAAVARYLARGASPGEILIDEPARLSAGSGFTFEAAGERVLW